MTTDPSYPKRALMITRMIFLAQFAGSLFFMIIVYYLGANRFFFRADMSETFLLPAIFLTFTAIPAGYIISRRKMAAIRQEDRIDRKYPVFQSALIIRLAACDGIALFSAVCLLITGNLVYLIFFILALTVMLTNYPTPDRIGKELNLTQSEIEQFYQ